MGEDAGGFQTHAGVVVGTFPEAGFVVVTIDGAIRLARPIPFSCGINEIVGDVAPALP